MRPYNKRVLVICLACTSIIAGLLQLAGITVFQFPPKLTTDWIEVISSNTFFTIFIHAVLLTINMTLMVCIISRKPYTWEIGCFCAVTACLLQLLDDARIHATILVLIVAIMTTKSIKLPLIRFTNLIILTTIYQLVASFYKFGVIPTSSDFTLYQIILYSIDNIVFITAIYVDTKGGKRNEEGHPLVDLVYPCFRLTQSRPETSHQAAEDVHLTTIDRVLMVMVAIGQVGVISAAVAINHRFIVFLIVYLLGFFPQKLATGFNYHAQTIGACTVQSLIAFYVACSIVPQVGISVLLPVCSGTAIVGVIWVLEWLRSNQANKRRH